MGKIGETMENIKTWENERRKQEITWETRKT